MYTLLIPVDSEQESAEYAVEAITEFPGSDQLTAVILNVQKEFDAPGFDSEEFYDETEFPKSVEIAEDRLRSAGIETTKRREHGDPAEQILEVAAEIDADQIVIGNKKRSPTGKALFGSVTQSVMLDTELPVTVVSRD